MVPVSAQAAAHPVTTAAKPVQLGRGEAARRARRPGTSRRAGRAARAPGPPAVRRRARPPPRPGRRRARRRRRSRGSRRAGRAAARPAPARRAGAPRRAGSRGAPRRASAGRRRSRPGSGRALSLAARSSPERVRRVRGPTTRGRSRRAARGASRLAVQRDSGGGRVVIRPAARPSRRPAPGGLLGGGEPSRDRPSPTRRRPCRSASGVGTRRPRFGVHVRGAQLHQHGWGCRCGPGRRRSTPRTATTRTAARRCPRTPVSCGVSTAPIGPG